MPGIFSKIKNGIASTGSALLFPGNATRTERNLRRARNLVILILISVLLWFITRKTGLEANINAPISWMRPFWLVLIFWISILATHVSRGLIELLRADPAEQMFPEIQRAWEHACKSMAVIGVRPSDLPIFLVLWQRESEGTYLFDSQQLRLRNIRLPGEITQPFHVDVSDSAIFVVCDQVSLTGTMVGRLQQKLAKKQFAGTSGYSAATAYVPPSLLGITHSESKEEGMARNWALVSGDELELPIDQSSDEDNLITSQDELEEISRKLGFLCSLISRTREPYCAVNGILVVLPVTIGDSDKITSHAIEMADIDMRVIREATGIDLSFAVLGTHIETIQGYGHVISRVDDAAKSRYLGLALPTRFDMKPEEWTKQIDRSLKWYERSVITSLFMKNIFHVDPENARPGESPRACLIRENHEAFRFMQILSRYWSNLSKTSVRLGESHIRRYQSNPRFAGLFLTGFDQQGAGPYVFMRDVIKHLVNQQSSLAWTPQALARDRVYRQVALCIKGILTVISVGVLLFALSRF